MRLCRRLWRRASRAPRPSSPITAPTSRASWRAAAAFVRSREIADGRVSVSGSLRVTLLYIADGSGGLKSFSYTLPVEETLDGRLREGCTEASVSGCVSALEVRALNPRKIMTRAAVELTVTPYCAALLTACGDVTQRAENGIETLCETQEVSIIKALRSKDFVFSDDLVLSSSKEPAAELLRESASVRTTECRLIGGKIILKGVVCVEVLYLSESGTICSAAAELPFSQIVEGVEDANENTSAEAMLCLTGAELRSETFRDLLNENQCEDHELRSALQDGVTRYSIKLRADGSLTVDSWILDGEVRQKSAPALELDPQAPEAPVITPDGGSYAEAQTVTITAASADAAIYYTLDGSDPLNGTLYTGPFTLEQSAVVRAVAVRGNSVSAEIRVEFTIETVHNAVLSFVSNGGSVVERVELPVGTALDLSAYVTEREGYDFTGWYLDAALTQPITSLTLEADTTVYAGWRIRNPFVDVAEKDYFYDAVLWGVENGVVKGMDETHFEPDTLCQRAHAVTFLWRAYAN